MYLFPTLLNDYVFIGYLLAFGLAAAVMFGSIFQARRFSSPDTRRGLIALLALSGCWAIAQVGFLVVPTPGARTLIYEMGLIAGFATVGAWLYFCSAFTGRTEHRESGPCWAWVILFALVVVTKVTNPWHGLYFSTALVSDPFPHLAIQHGALYWTSNGLAYALTAIGFFMLYEGFTRLGRTPAPLLGLIGLMLLPLALNVAGSYGDVLLDINHDALGVAVFAVGVLFILNDFILNDQFEGAQRSIAARAPTLLLGPTGEVRNFNTQAAALRPALKQRAGHQPPLGSVWPEAQTALHDGSPLTVTQNGHRAHFRLTEASLDTSGLPLRHIVFTDITEEFERTRAQETHLLGIADSIPGVIFQFRVHPDGTTSTRQVSGQAAALLGLTNENHDFCERILDFIPEPYRTRHQESVAAAVASKSRWEFEFPFDSPAGPRLWLEGISIPDPSAEEQVFNGVLLDITDRKRREQERLDARTRMELVLQNTGTMIFEVDLSTGERHRIGAVEDVLGLPPDDIPAGDGYFDVVVHPEDAPRMRRFLQALLDGNEPPQPVAYRTNPDLGPVRWLEEQVYHSDPAAGTGRRIFGITRDVTARQHYQQGLREAKERAEEVSALKSSILANMSHEIRTPLTGIIGFAQLLSAMDLGAEAEQFSGSIYRSGLRLLDTLNSVLDLSQLEAGAIDLRQEDVVVDDLLRDVVQDLSQRAGLEAPSVTVETDRASTTLQTDPAALTRVITNLLGNAIKFTPHDGHVNVQLTSASDALILRVQDTGVGIGPDFLPDLFTPFTQESTGKTRSFEGNGLGLAITKQLVDLLGGTIAVDSTKGAGTTFTVRLPR